MSGNQDNLLIDFNNVNLDDGSTVSVKSEGNSVVIDQNVSTPPAFDSMAFMCSSQPLYKLLGCDTDDIKDNNPFDHLDKRACLSDDPFEIVENAVLTSESHTEAARVETGTLISIDSPIIAKTDAETNKSDECDTPKSSSIKNSKFDKQTNDSVQKSSQKQSPNMSPKVAASPSGKSRNKGKNTSLSLLKYSLSNSRLDVEESGDDQLGKNPSSRRDSATDDSFDDIWSTKPNLIDSQTDIDLDMDNDLATLNIPMLNISTPNKSPDASKGENEVVEDSVDMKHNRVELLEKFASIKQKKLESPAVCAPQIHDQTVSIKCNPSNEEEPVTPKSQFSLVQLQEETSSDPNALIEKMQKLVDQCDDKTKQTTAKHLLENLTSILTKNDSSENIEKSSSQTVIPPPQPMKRQGTFSIEKESSDVVTDESKHSDMDQSKHSPNETTDRPIDSGLSEVVKQIQSAFGAHQNINVIQTNVQQTEATVASTNNPTYIVVMTQPMNDGTEPKMPQLSRSRSFTCKEKLFAEMRSQRVPSSMAATPTKPRPTLQRRGSFGSITRPTITTDKPFPGKTNAINPVAKPDASKVIRRRSFQGPSPTEKAIQPIELPQTRPLNAVNRRRSFQGMPSTSGIRSPSPRSSMTNNTTGMPRRRSLTNELAKDSPQKQKSSYGIMKKPLPPPATRNLKIRVSQGTGRSNAPLRAVAPLSRVSSLLLINETISPGDDNKSAPLITSTPRSIPTPVKSLKGLNDSYVHIMSVYSLYIQNVIDSRPKGQDKWCQVCSDL